MNIWILNHYAITPDSAGGTRHYDLAREIVKEGHKVTIFAASYNHFNKQSKPVDVNKLSAIETINGIRFVWLKTPAYRENDWRRAINMLCYSFLAVSTGIKLKEKPDTIMASSPHLFTGISGWLLSRFKKADFVFEVRDLWPQTLIDIGDYKSNSIIVKTLRVIEKFIYRKARAIITLPPGAVDYITGLGISPAKVFYIPNGVSPELYNSVNPLPDILDKVMMNARSYGKFLVVYAGSHGITNQLDVIIKAAQILQNKGHIKIHFLFVGDGPEKSNLIALAKESELHNIVFFNAIPKLAVPNLIKNGDVAVLSWKKTALYRYGISANKLWDYMICSIPVIWAIDTSVNIVEEAKCGITVPPEDAEAMAEAILKLSKMTNTERKEMGNRGYDYVIKYHSTPLLAKKLLEVLKDVHE
jgi:glycosyltransferase involved in cell wall biosynthesis